jgi:hypothetical protein
MSLQTDIQSDWNLIDGVEEITLTPSSQRADVTDTPITAVKALQRLYTRRLANYSEAMALNGAVVFEVWAVKANGTNVRTSLGRDLRDEDLITAASGTWEIKTASWSNMTSRWICQCVKSQANAS